MATAEESVPSSSEGTDAAKVGDSNKGTGTIHIRQTQLLGLAFWLLFNAYSAAQVLQTAINGKSGYACLGILYGLFSMSALAAPFIVGYLGYIVLIPLSAVPYVLMVGVNMAPTLGTLIPACGAVGVAAATLWSAQAMYAGRCAALYSEKENLPLSKANSLLNAKFYAIFASSGGVSNVMASIIIMKAEDAIKTLFVYLTIVGVCAVILFSFMADPASNSLFERTPICLRMRRAKQADARIITADANNSGYDETNLSTVVKDEEAAQPPPSSPVKPSVPKPPTIPSIQYMLRFLFKREMRFMTGILLTSGLGMGVFNGVWMGSIVAKSVGVGYVGFIGAAYSFTSAVATVVWGKLTQKNWFGRRWAIVGASTFHMVFLLSSMLWAYRYTDAGEDGPDTGVAVPLLLLLSMLYACGDSVWFSQLQATLQTFFPDGDDLPCAMASIRLYTSLGFSVATVVSVALGGRVAVQLLVQALSLLLSCASMWYMHKHISPIDPQTKS